jgi:hypothetical protein
MATCYVFLQGVVSHLLYLACTLFHGLRLRKWEDSPKKKKGLGKVWIWGENNTIFLVEMKVWKKNEQGEKG